MANMDPKKMDAQKLEDHVFGTYTGLRIGVVAIAVALPIVLALGGCAIFHIALKPSISAYYDSQMRDWFAGSLFAAGVCLYLYKGFTPKENIALNISGVLALGVALFPFDWRPWGEVITPHGVCAVSFFAGVAWVCWFRAGDTLELIPDAKVRKRFKMLYKSIAIALAASPAAAALFNVIGGFGAMIFWVETFAIYVFAFYWFTKTRELKLTHAAERSMKGGPEAEAIAKMLPG